MFISINPATGEEIARFSAHTEADIDAALSAAVKAQAAWRQRSLAGGTPPTSAQLVGWRTAEWHAPARVLWPCASTAPGCCSSAAGLEALLSARGCRQFSSRAACNAHRCGV